MRRAITISVALLCVCILTAQAPNPDYLLQRGREAYRSGRYTEALNDLRSAADAFLSPEQMKTYVNTGGFESLPKFETAIVYLILTYAKLGRDTEAREQIRRLEAAEAIAPTYAKLALETDIADFEPVVRRIDPTTELPANTALAALGVTPPLAQVAQAPPLVPPPAPAPAVEPEQRVAVARAAAETEAQQRIAAEIAAFEKQVQERIAADRAAIMKAADEKIAAERAAAEQRVAEARAAAEKEAQARLASERAALEKQTQERIAAERAAAQKAAEARVAAAEAESRRMTQTALRKAETLTSAGQLDEANAAYLRLLNSPDASRETIAAAATGLYRTGAYNEAVGAFRRLGTFARGEEDLRFYKAVSLYETGRYEEAKRELACALPYIQLTDEVLRYRAKIEQTHG